MEEIVAFIPARGGSKSIPLKNVRLLFGKPLIYWVTAALERTDPVHRIIIATDSDEIESTVNDFHFGKVEVFRRSPENATDTAGTESVMLEYLSKAGLNEDDVFMLVQATSPLTKAEHFSEALAIFSGRNYDSMLSCVRIRRFLWNDNGTPKNYDYMNRPRRQDFKGELMENGAFYISGVGQIMRSKNRMGGRIGIYEMPEYTGLEIDEPHDWLIMEQLMRSQAEALL